MKTAIETSKQALGSNDAPAISTAFENLQAKLEALSTELYRQAAEAQQDVQDVADDIVSNEANSDDVVDSTMED